MQKLKAILDVIIQCLKNNRMILYCFIYLNSSILISQNLVTNPSFENYNSIECSMTTSKTNFDNLCSNWYHASDGYGELLSTLSPLNCFTHCTNASTYNGSNCFRGHQLPRTGDVMLGLQLYNPDGSASCDVWTEYAQTTLLNKLEKGKMYCAEMYVSLSDNSPFAINNIGMCFSKNILDHVTCLPHELNAQIFSSAVVTDTSNWVKISGYFIAEDDYAYLTIGNFNIDSTSFQYVGGSCNNKGAYYYIDDISVYEATPMFNQLLPNDTILCYSNNSSSFQLQLTETFEMISWSNGDSGQGISVNQSGKYWLTAYRDCQVFTDTITLSFLEQPQINLGKDTAICENESVAVNLPNLNYNYEWYNASVASNITLSIAGVYWVTATNSCGADTDSILINVNQLPKVNLGNDTIICNGSTITLTPGIFKSYLWQNKSTDAYFNTTSTGLYSVLVTDSNNCQAFDEINIEFYQTDFIDLGEDTLLCPNQSLTLNAGSGFQNYNWNTGNTMPSIIVSSSGTYIVEALIGNCLSADTIIVQYLNSQSPTLGNDTTLCPGDSLTLDVSNNFLNYLWQNGATSSSIVVNKKGEYIVNVIDSNSCTSADTMVVNYVSLPNTSGHQNSENNYPDLLYMEKAIICDSAIQLFCEPIFDSYHWSTGDTTNSTLVSNTGYVLVTTTYNTCEFKDSVLVDKIQNSSLSIGNDTSITTNDTLILNAGSNYATYYWQNGSTDSVFYVTQAGTYYVTVFDSNNCDLSDTIKVSINQITNLQENQHKAFTYKMYTFDNTLYLNLHCKSNTSITVDINDVNGRQLSTLIHQTFINGDYKFQFDFNYLPAGMYFLNIHSPKYNDAFQFVHF